MKGNELAYIVMAILFSPLIVELIKLISILRKKRLDKKRIFSVVKKVLGILFICLIFILTLNRINFLNYKKPMPYSEIDNITFEDFLGFEFFQTRLNGNKRFAYIVTTIDYEFHDEGLMLTAFFHPSRSYVYNKYAYSKELLRHELYHFRITEAYARKIRREITLNPSLSESEIEVLVNKFKKEERAYQKLYDYDTYHSYILREQRKYEKEIDSLITSLDNYSDVNIQLNETN